jgi:drug/metabolite transporter (DMT)-like permease
VAEIRPSGGRGTPPSSEFDAFAGADWALVGAVAGMWGSSFLFIALGLEHFEPALVTLLRLFFGAATLAIFPRARRSVPRSQWPPIALLGLVWMAAPLLLFPLAQQWIDSSLAGMLNGAAPLFTAAVATVILRRLPGRAQRAGLAIGFLGVVAVSWPAVQEARATALGAGLVLLATFLYGIAINLAVPLQRRHGALPVIWRAQLFSLVLIAPLGLAGLEGSSFSWVSLLAVAALGCFGTGLAFVAFTVLVGRVGAARGSVTIYLVPVVAIVLGVWVRGETVAATSVLGTGLILIGAYLTSRKER